MEIATTASVDGSLLVLRLVFGLLLIGHGTQKAFGWFGGHGIRGTGGVFEQLGFRPGVLFATLAAYGEIISGTLITLGFLGPIGPALVVSVMVVAALAVHWKNGLFVTSNGIEVPLIYTVVAIAVGIAGPGAYSLDTALGTSSYWTPSITWGVLGAGFVGGLANLALRKTASTVPTT